jgi:hypothetical protein
MPVNPIDDATAAAVAYIVEHLDGLPADRGRQEWFFRDVLVEYAALVVAAERERLVAPREN